MGNTRFFMNDFVFLLKIFFCRIIFNMKGFIAWWFEII